MINEEYLDKCRVSREVYIKEISSMTPDIELEKVKVELRKAIALEIIAEALISIDANIDYISNEVPTALNRR